MRRRMRRTPSSSSRCLLGMGCLRPRSFRLGPLATWRPINSPSLIYMRDHRIQEAVCAGVALVDMSMCT